VARTDTSVIADGTTRPDVGEASDLTTAEKRKQTRGPTNERTFRETDSFPSRIARLLGRRSTECRNISPPWTNFPPDYTPQFFEIDSATPYFTPIGALMGCWAQKPVFAHFLIKISEYKHPETVYLLHISVLTTVTRKSISIQDSFSFRGSKFEALKYTSISKCVDRKDA